MIVGVVVALRAEAAPFVRSFRLRRRLDVARWELFHGDDIALIVSGVGKLKSAIATTILLDQVTSLAAVVNVGVAGCDARFARIGDAFQIHRIDDEASGRSYFPDMLVSSGFPETRVATLDRPGREPRKNSCLVDMEAAGFYEAASYFLPPHGIHVIKIVSDFMEPASLSGESVMRLLEPYPMALRGFFHSLAVPPESRDSPLTEQDEVILEQLKSHLRLTATQYHHLCRSATSFCIRTGKTLQCLEEFLTYPTSSKIVSKSILTKALQVLNAGTFFPPVR